MAGAGTAWNKSRAATALDERAIYGPRRIYRVRVQSALFCTGRAQECNSRSWQISEDSCVGRNITVHNLSSIPANFAGAPISGVIHKLPRVRESVAAIPAKYGGSPIAETEFRSSWFKTDKQTTGETCKSKPSHRPQSRFQLTADTNLGLPGWRVLPTGIQTSTCTFVTSGPSVAPAGVNEIIRGGTLFAMGLAYGTKSKHEHGQHSLGILGRPGLPLFGPMPGDTIDEQAYCASPQNDVATLVTSAFTVPSLNSNVQIDVLDTTDFTVGTFVDNATNGAFLPAVVLGCRLDRLRHADDAQATRYVRRCRYDDWLGRHPASFRESAVHGEPLEHVPLPAHIERHAVFRRRCRRVAS